MNADLNGLSAALEQLGCVTYAYATLDARGACRVLVGADCEDGNGIVGVELDVVSWRPRQRWPRANAAPPPRPRSVLPGVV